MTGAANTNDLVDLLQQKQILTAAQVHEIYEYRDQLGLSAEQALLELGILTEEDLAAFVSDVLQVRYLKLEDVEIDPEATRHIPAAVAHRWGLIPVRRSGNALAVAFADPTNREAIAAVNGVTDFEIIPFVGRHDAIEHAIYLHYGEAPVAGELSATSLLAYARPQNLMDDDRISHMGKSIQIHRAWCFEQLVEDAANPFPVNIARAIAAFEPDTGYHPFLCWGPAGCGKSHLLHAMANHVAAHFPLKRFILTTGERFAQALFEAIRDRKLNLFRYLYRELDLLLIDDADAILQREWVQQELVETLEALTQNNKQLVLTARQNLAVHPRVLPALKASLSTGVAAAIGEYSMEARLQILSRRKGGAEVPQEMLLYLIRQCGDDVSQLLNLLQEITVQSVQRERRVTKELVDDLLRLFGADSADAHGAYQQAMAQSTDEVAADGRP